MLGAMSVLTPPRPAQRATPSRPALFIVSRDLPGRYNSLAFAFDGDRAVRVIFDRRRGIAVEWTRRRRSSAVRKTADRPIVIRRCG
jgi:hypothetical protein